MMVLQSALVAQALRRANSCPTLRHYRRSPQLGGGGQDFRSNSFGGQVMPTISACEYKMCQKQKDTTGGYVLHMFRHEDRLDRSTSNSTTPVNGSVWGV